MDERPARVIADIVRSVVSLAIVSKPAVWVMACRVVVCPMDYAAAFVPLVFAHELDWITAAKVGDARGQVDVVGD